MTDEDEERVDARLSDLLEMLPEAWARTELGEELDTVARYCRAAYGVGYVDGLKAGSQ